jgi:hypothetical protein
MIRESELTAEALGDFLAKEMNRRCGSSHPRLTELVPFAAQLALECISRVVLQALFMTAKAPPISNTTTINTITEVFIATSLCSNPR